MGDHLVVFRCPECGRETLQQPKLDGQILCIKNPRGFSHPARRMEPAGRPK